MKSINRTRALSLIELLVVIAIIVVLAGLVASVYFVGKDRAKVVVDMSNLHQIGLAGAIYAGDYDDQPALSTLPLLKSGYIKDDIVVSPTDESESGLAVSFRLGIGLPVDEYLATAPKITYIGPGEGDWPVFVYRSYMEETPNQGWLVDLTRGEREHEDSISTTEGRYQRLLFDTSVITRRMGETLVDVEGTLTRSFEFKRYFADFEDNP
ncbi:MAG: type II secretion system protein [Fimbriimonadaceae bacterium]